MVSLTTKSIEEIKKELETENENTWCPGCFNFFILESAKKTISKLIKEGEKQENFAMVTGIGCHAKIFDYLNISGIYGLHGRVIPLAMGIKLGNPNLKVIGFAGDGDTYSEGMEHFIHVCRFNPDFTLVVHDNQTFALTTGQSTPTSQQGFKNKAEPLGEFNNPLNPIKLALVAGASFVARCDSRDVNHTAEILEKAIKHKGFSYIEIIQPCLQFNKEETITIEKLAYKVNNEKDDMQTAMKLADEWNYNEKTGKIPTGILYKAEKPTLEEKWPLLSTLQKKKITWKELKK